MPEAVDGGWLCIRGPVYEQPRIHLQTLLLRRDQIIHRDKTLLDFPAYHTCRLVWISYELPIVAGGDFS